MATESGYPPLEEFIGDELRNNAHAIVDRWIHHLSTEFSIRPLRELPREAIVEHIPPVVRGIARFVETPVPSVKFGLTADLSAHAKARREQGYDIEELLLEFESLSRIVTDVMIDAIQAYPGHVDPVHVARLSNRLREGLAEITIATVGFYRDVELQRRREMRDELFQFARILGHELRNLMQAMSAGADMLDRPEILQRETERMRFLDLIRRGISRLSALTDEILILATGSAEPEGAYIPLREAIQSAYSEVESMAAEKGVEFQVVEPLPDVAVASARARLVLANLISNSIKYSDPEKPQRWVRVGARPADTGTAESGAALAGPAFPEGDRGLRLCEVYVEDNGLGIPEDVQPRIFERHIRAHPHAAEGTGLGLTIAREAVEQRGGRIWFESREGEGSTFHFTIPVVGANGGRPAGAAARTGTGEPGGDSA